MGRAIHTFKSEYITKDDERRISKELDEHVAAVLENTKNTKASLSHGAAAIRARHDRHLLSRHNIMIAVAHDRLKEASQAYNDVVEQQVKTLRELRFTAKEIMSRLDGLKISTMLSLWMVKSSNDVKEGNDSGK